MAQTMSYLDHFRLSRQFQKSRQLILVDFGCQVSDGLGKFSNGVGKLSDGLGKLSDGLGKLSDRLGKLLDGLGNLSNRLGEVSVGFRKF